MGTYTLQLEPVFGSNQAALTSPVAADNPLSASHHRELAAARDLAKPIHKAARIAAFNGWTTAVIAALSAPFALFDYTGALLTIGMSIVAYNEFRGRKRLLRFEPSGASLLGWNQLGLLAMIVVYSLWSLWGSYGDAGSLSSELGNYAELDAALGGTGAIEALVQQISLAVYGGVIGLSLIFQGGNALYYFSRRRHREAFVAKTPQWVRDVQSGSYSGGRP